MRERAGLGRQGGMTLVEAVVATAVVAAGCVAVAHLVAWGVGAVWEGGAASAASAAAQAKLEELLAREWRVDDTGRRISDPALRASPADALTTSVDGYVEYLDAHGEPLAAGSDPPPSAVFVRRWSIRPLGAAPDDALVIQVLVAPMARVQAGGRGTAEQRAGAARLITARTRMR